MFQTSIFLTRNTASKKLLMVKVLWLYKNLLLVSVIVVLLVCSAFFIFVYIVR